MTRAVDCSGICNLQSFGETSHDTLHILSMSIELPIALGSVSHGWVLGNPSVCRLSAYTRGSVRSSIWLNPQTVPAYEEPGFAEFRVSILLVQA